MGDSEVFRRAVRGVHSLLETYPAMPARVTALYIAHLWLIFETASCL